MTGKIRKKHGRRASVQPEKKPKQQFERITLIENRFSLKEACFQPRRGVPVETIWEHNDQKLPDSQIEFKISGAFVR